jgi:hypothetical protein
LLWPFGCSVFGSVDECDASARSNELLMTDGERPFREKLALQIVIRKIDNIFAECGTFKERDKKILLEVIGSLLLQHMRQLPHIRAAQTSVPAADGEPPAIKQSADTAPTDTAPTDGIRQILISIADLCEAELQTIEDATPPSPQ